MERLKIYGERNTGTNYLSKLVEENIKVKLLRGTAPRNKYFKLPEPLINLYFYLTKESNLGWKHTILDLNLIKSYKFIDKTYFVTLTKNPYSFLLSLYKRPYHLKEDRASSFEEFVSNRWKLQYRDGETVEEYLNPIELWNKKNKSYMYLYNKFEDRVINCKYEELLLDPSRQIDEIVKKFNIKVSKEFANHTKSTKNDNKSFNDYQKYYLDELWKKDLTKQSIEIINSYLDDEVLAYYKYKKLT